MTAGPFRHLFALTRDLIAPGEPIAQWTHFVTSRCNARCAHCFYPINAKNNELTLEEIDKLTRTLPPIRLLLISGGEPFLRKDLPELVRLYFERCHFFSVAIPSNGWAAAPIVEQVKRICDISPDLALGVSISLDGFGPLHERIRRLPGLFEKALQTLRSLIALASRRPNLTIGVTTIFMRDNQAELPEFCRFIHDEFRPSHHSLGLIRGEPFDPAQKQDLNVDSYLELSRWIDERYPPDSARHGWRGVRTRARREVNRRRYEYVARQAKGGVFETFCLAGEREFVLSEDGIVYGCELIGLPIGNVRDAGYDFARLRSGPGAAAFVRSKIDRLCHCSHECNTRTMILFDRSNALPIAAAMVGLEGKPRS